MWLVHIVFGPNTLSILMHFVVALLSEAVLDYSSSFLLVDNPCVVHTTLESHHGTMLFAGFLLQCIVALNIVVGNNWLGQWWG